MATRSHPFSNNNNNNTPGTVSTTTHATIQMDPPPPPYGSDVIGPAPPIYHQDQRRFDNLPSETTSTSILAETVATRTTS